MSDLKRRGLGCVSLLVILLMIAALGVFIFAMIVGPEVLRDGSLSNLKQPAERFDPIQALPDVGAMMGPSTRYWQFMAQGVRSDGTVDLTADYAPLVTYQSFAESASTGAPLGAPGQAAMQLVIVHAMRPGWHVASRDSDGTSWRLSRGLERSQIPWHAHTTGLPTSSSPTCPLAKLWEQAIAQGTPADAVAQIVHNAQGYRFTIEGTSIEHRFDQGCSLLPR